MNLLDRWLDLGSALLPGPVDDVWRSWGSLLLDLYSAPSRYYHDQWHIEEVLQRLDAHRSKFRDPATAEVALWFHDAIYAVPSKRNEEASAEMCAAFLTSIGNETCRRAPLMILATKHDGKMAPDQDTALVLDIDLAGFAGPWDDFAADNERIRQEFAVYDDKTFRAGRANFLRGLLDRGPIFRVLTEWEAAARANIGRHIAELEIAAAFDPKTRRDG